MFRNRTALVFLLAGSAFGGLPECPGDLSFPTKTVVTNAGVCAVSGEGCEVVLSGTIAGDVTISADSICRVTLDDVVLSGGLAIEGDAILRVKGSSTLDNAGKAVVSATGALMLAGDGVATVTGGGAKAKNAVIYAKNKLAVAGGTWNVNMSLEDAAKGYGLASGKKDVVISGGTLRVTQPGPKSVAIGSDATIRMTGGAVHLDVGGAGARGIKCDGAFEMSCGLLEAKVSGDPLYEPCEWGDGTNLVVTTSKTALIASGTYFVEDVTCAAAVKCGTVRVSGGTVRIVADGAGSRGLVADTTLDLSGGVFDIRANGATSEPVVELVTDDDLTQVQIDRKTATCIRQGDASGTATISGGVFRLVATNDGGKCISADGALTVGVSGAVTLPTDAAFAPDIQCETYGQKRYVSAGKFSLYGTLGTAVATTDVSAALRLSANASRVVVWNSAGAEYAHPKGVKAEGAIVFESGRLRMFSQCDGGEGLESKADLTVNGGILEGTCHDDVIQAEGAITVNGGCLYCGSTCNDAIDANGSVIINGGVVLAFTLMKPEVGIDVDEEDDLKINGGIVLAVGSATKWQYGSTGTQIAYRNPYATLATYSGMYLRMANTDVWVKVPAANSTSGKCSLLCSAPGCVDSEPTVSTAASGTDLGFHGVHTNGSALVSAFPPCSAGLQASGSGSCEFSFDAFLTDWETSDVPYKAANGDVYALRAAPLVDWIKADGAIVSSLPTRPKTCNTRDLKDWLTKDVSNLEAYLYADEIASDANFKPLSVSGTNFLFAAQDLPTLPVARAAPQVSTDLAAWEAVSDGDLVDGVYTMPAKTSAFARIVYSLTW